MLKIGFLLISIFILIIIFLVVPFLRFDINVNQYSVYFSISSFLFGIFIGFAISNSRSRLDKINEALKEEEGRLVFIYKSSEVFGDHIKSKIRKLIDDYLIDQIDYYLPEWNYSNKSFHKLFDYILELKPKDNVQEEIYSQMIELLREATQSRRKIGAFVKEKILILEWITIFILLFVVLFSIFIMNDGTFLAVIISFLLSSSAIAIVLVLKDLDNLKWKENSWIWEPLEQTFNDLELLPYFPDDVIKSGRAQVNKGQKIRIAHYPNKYPDMTNKKIEIIEV